MDVARFGSDKSVILKRRGMAVEEIQTFRGLDTMKLTGRIVDAIKAWDPDQVLIDEVGIGAGVVDRLRELGHRVRGVNVGKPARDTEHYANLRAEGYWTLRQLFAEGKVSIPADNDLGGPGGRAQVLFQQPWPGRHGEQGRDAAAGSLIARQGRRPHARLPRRPPQAEILGMTPGSNAKEERYG